MAAFTGASRTCCFGSLNSSNDVSGPITRGSVTLKSVKLYSYLWMQIFFALAPTIACDQITTDIQTAQLGVKLRSYSSKVNFPSRILQQ